MKLVEVLKENESFQVLKAKLEKGERRVREELKEKMYCWKIKKMEKKS